MRYLGPEICGLNVTRIKYNEMRYFGPEIGGLNVTGANIPIVISVITNYCPCYMF